MTDPRLVLADTLHASASELTQQVAVTGFDGFVDEMITVVDERQDLETFRPMVDIAGFGAWVSGAAGRSSLKEIVVDRQDPGGCAVNLGDGLIGLGIQLDCYATLGQPQAAAFDHFASRCRHVESWGTQPGRTLAFEFPDGKLMFASVSQLGEIDPELVCAAIAGGRFAQSCAEAGLIAFTNWTLYPHMTACWRQVQEQVLAQCSHHPWLFLDLVDPRSRSEADIRAMLEAIPGFESQCRTVLGLNLNEANAIAAVFDIPPVDEEPQALADQAAAIRERLGIAQVVTHALRHAAVATAARCASAEGPFCPSPRKSVGAGDRFNAGYAAGLLLGLDDEQRLLLGNAASGFFVRNARSGTAAELAALCRAWAHGTLD